MASRASAQRRQTVGIARVVAYVGGVVPAALALGAVGGDGGDAGLRVGVLDVGELDLRDVEELLEAGLVAL